MNRDSTDRLETRKYQMLGSPISLERGGKAMTAAEAAVIK